MKFANRNMNGRQRIAELKIFWSYHPVQQLKQHNVDKDLLPEPALHSRDQQPETVYTFPP